MYSDFDYIFKDLHEFSHRYYLFSLGIEVASSTATAEGVPCESGLAT